MRGRNLGRSRAQKAKARSPGKGTQENAEARHPSRILVQRQARKGEFCAPAAGRRCRITGKFHEFASPPPRAR